jgi:hypothetical protein
LAQPSVNRPKGCQPAGAPRYWPPFARRGWVLTVPLYSRIYDHYKGYTLPGAAALEKFMRDVGVSSKQTRKARIAFTRSAKQAGFFAHGDDRLVRPATPGPRTKPVESIITDAEKDANGKGARVGGGKDTDLGLDALLIALLKKIPTDPSAGWPGPARVRWFRTFAMNVSQICDSDGEPVEMKIELEKEASN